jgi:hypothetical protein
MTRASPGRASQSASNHTGMAPAPGVEARRSSAPTSTTGIASTRRRHRRDHVRMRPDFQLLVRPHCVAPQEPRHQRPRAKVRASRAARHGANAASGPMACEVDRQPRRRCARSARPLRPGPAGQATASVTSAASLDTCKRHAVRGLHRLIDAHGPADAPSPPARTSRSSRGAGMPDTEPRDRPDNPPDRFHADVAGPGPNHLPPRERALPPKPRGHRDAPRLPLWSQLVRP